MSENAEVHSYLKTGRSLTVESARQLGLTSNLRSRISNLIGQGVKIVKSWLTVRTSKGVLATVRVYSL